MKSINFIDNVVMYYIFKKSYFIARNAVVVKLKSLESFSKSLIAN